VIGSGRTNQGFLGYCRCARAAPAEEQGLQTQMPGSLIKAPITFVRVVSRSRAPKPAHEQNNLDSYIPGPNRPATRPERWKFSERAHGLRPETCPSSPLEKKRIEPILAKSTRLSSHPASIPPRDNARLAASSRLLHREGRRLGLGQFPLSCRETPTPDHSVSGVFRGLVVHFSSFLVLSLLSMGGKVHKPRQETSHFNRTVWRLECN
jgi:hypothetical protein